MYIYNGTFTTGNYKDKTGPFMPNVSQSIFFKQCKDIDQIQASDKSQHCLPLNRMEKKVGEKSRECHNHKPQPFPDPKRKRKPTNLNKHKPNKRTKITKISSLFPKRGNRKTKRIEKHKKKMTHVKTYNKSPLRINHKATKSKTNTGTTALERSVEQTTEGFKALQNLQYFISHPLNTDMAYPTARMEGFRTAK